MSSKNGRKFMDAVTYAGNATTQSISGLDFSPDLVWVKNRTSATVHGLYDTLRGAGVRLSSDGTAGESADNSLTSFDANGFTTGQSGTTNETGNNYVAWCWDAGGETVTNNDGTIESQVRANPEAGFSVVSYTGSGSAGTVGHGLGKTPGLVIVKNRNSGSDWSVWNKAFGGGNTFMFLNSTSAFSSSASYWNNDVPTDTTISVGVVNAAANDYIAYCWSEIPGYSKIGQYRGNGTASNFVYTGFKPRYILTKPYTAVGDWLIWDTQRDPINPNDATLSANTSDPDHGGSGYDINVVSNGFQLAEFGASSNASGVSYVFMAFADKPTFTPQETTLTLEGSTDLETIDVGALVYQGGVSATVKSKNAATNQLTFAGSHNFQEDSPVHSDVNGEGIISSINIATNRMTLTDVVGSFAPGKGRSVIGSVRRMPKYQSETSGLIGAVDAGVDYEVQQSLIFDNSHLSKTPSASGNQGTWTWSGWVKRSALTGGGYDCIFGANDNANNWCEFGFNSDDKVYFYWQDSGSSVFMSTNETFTDCSKWTNLVVAVDTTQATSSDRIKVYADGVQLTWASATFPAQNFQTAVNSTYIHNIGDRSNNAGLDFIGYLADVQFVDGVAHDANAFGYFDAYGFWNAKNYTDPKALDTITAATDSQLTLASNNNFGELAVGKTIQQDSGYTATTDTISSVNVTTTDTAVSLVPGTTSSTLQNPVFGGGTYIWSSARSASNGTMARVTVGQEDSEGTTYTTGGMFIKSGFQMAIDEDGTTGFAVAGSGAWGSYAYATDDAFSTAHGLQGSFPWGTNGLWGAGYVNGAFIALSDAGLTTNLYSITGSPGRSELEVSSNWSQIDISGAGGTSFHQMRAPAISHPTDTNGHIGWVWGNQPNGSQKGFFHTTDGVNFYITAFSSGGSNDPAVAGYLRKPGSSERNWLVTFNTYSKIMWYDGDIRDSGSDVAATAFAGESPGGSFDNTRINAILEADGVVYVLQDGVVKGCPVGATSNSEWTTLTTTGPSGSDNYDGLRRVGSRIYVTFRNQMAYFDLAETQLVLSGAQDLVNLRVGDVVSGNTLTTVTQYVAGTDDGATAATKTGATYRILGSDLWADYSDGETVELDDLFGGAAWNMVWWEHSTSTSADGTAISSRGPSESDTVASWKTAIQDSLYYSFSYYGTSTTSPDTSAYGAVGSDAEVITFTKPVSVTGVSAGTNQLTVSGGTWSNGNTVSADLAAGVGTVTAVDTTTNTIDYTLSGGRFIGGESKVAQVLTNEYGTNGFRLPFTPGDLGKDSFGDNDWTPNNFESDASVVDSPTNYGTDTGVGNEVRGNYATLNPFSGDTNISRGNLDQGGNASTWRGNSATIGVSGGKWYFESTIQNTDSGNVYADWGIVEASNGYFTGQEVGDYGISYHGRNGQKEKNNTSVSTDSSGATTGDVIQVAFDLDNGKIWFGVNNTWIDSGNPSAGTNAAYTVESGTWLPAVAIYDGGTVSTNFGQKEFQYPAPAGFKTLNTHNL